MTHPRNRYPQFGTGSIVVYSLDAALEEVRIVYPDAYMEGSAGLERLFFKPLDRKAGEAEPLVVGHTWNSGRPTRDQRDRWYVRVAKEPFIL